MKRLLFLIFVISTICQAQYKELRWYYKLSDSTYTTVPDFVTLPSADTIDTKVAYADSNSSLGWYRRGYVDALLNAKQNTITNLADTSKYFESMDSSGTTGWYRRGYVDALLNLKQNTIPNLSDTSKYFEQADSAGTYGWYRRAYIDALISAITGTGVITLNGLNGVTQTLAIDTTVTGAPAWSSATTVHTLQLPYARFWKKSEIDTTISRDTLYSESVSKLTSGVGITVTKANKSYQVKADTTTLATKDFVANQYTPIDSLSTLRTEMNAKMDSINALRAEIEDIWAFINALTAPPAYPATAWYISSSTGFDADNNGHNPALPLATIARLTELGGALSGDTVNLLAGDTFYESLTISNDTVLVKSYGTGNDPIISGALPITSGWVQNGNVWAYGTTSTVYDLYYNGTRQTLARLPNAGWYRCDAGTTSSSIVSADITTGVNALVGCTLRVLGAIWAYQNKAVTASGVGSATLASAMSWTPSTGYGFFIEGDPLEADTAGEWVYDDSQDSIRWYPPAGVSPNSVTSYASIRSAGITISQSYVSVSDVQIEKTYGYGVNITGTPRNVRVENSLIKETDIGVSFEGAATYCTVNSNIITDCYNRGINVYLAKYSNFESDSIRRIGIVPGKTNQPMAIASTEAASGHNVISKNKIDSVGYVGIYGEQGDRIDSNVVKNCILTQDDGGCIYITGDSVTVRTNICENAVGYVGASGATYPASNVLIYFDSGASYCTASNNTVKGTGNCGLFNQYTSMYNTYTNNTVYDVKTPAGITAYSDRSAGFKLLQSTDYAGWGNLTFNYNVIFSSDTTAYQGWAEQRSDTAEFLDFGDNDYNKYLNPYAQNRMFLKFVPGSSYGYYDLPTWQDTTADDANAGSIWRQWLSTEQKDSLFVNEFNYPITYTVVENTWRNYDGTLISGTSLTIPADSAKLLFDFLDTDTLLVQYAETNQDADGVLSVANGSAGRSQGFYGDGNYIGGFWAYVKRIGTATYYTARLCANTGTYGSTSRPVTNASLAVSDSIDCGAYSTDYAWVHFIFQTPYKLTNGTVYHIALTTWDASSSHCLSWGRDTSTSTDPANPAAAGNPAGAWSSGTSDLIYKIYTRDSP